MTLSIKDLKDLYIDEFIHSKKNEESCVLTKAEERCVKLFLKLNSIASVAHSLNVHENTVKYHMTSVYSQLNFYKTESCQKKSLLIEEFINYILTKQENTITEGERDERKRNAGVLKERTERFKKKKRF